MPTRINQHWKFSGIDCHARCLDKQHFSHYPYDIDYYYNSRGFRDNEWPTSEKELKDTIWCVGDSFTVGIGQPLHHTWPFLLGSALGCRTINVSMDGASNDWIYRRAQQIHDEIAPSLIVVMWSYTHRRESEDSSLSDEERRILSSREDTDEDLLHWTDLVNRLRQLSPDIIECTIPRFHDLSDIDAIWKEISDPSWPPCPTSLAEFKRLPPQILTEIQHLHGCAAQLESLFHLLDLGIIPHSWNQAWPRAKIIRTEPVLDLARDHHHFDIKTAQRLVVDIRSEIDRKNLAKIHVLPVSDAGSSHE